jgi:hypothetical protein
VDDELEGSELDRARPLSAVEEREEALLGKKLGGSGDPDGARALSSVENELSRRRCSAKTLFAEKKAPVPLSSSVEEELQRASAEILEVVLRAWKLERARRSRW